LEDGSSSRNLFQLEAFSFLRVATSRNPFVPMERREPTLAR